MNNENPKCKDIPKKLWPPQNSIETELEVYRLLRQKGVVTYDDFLSLYELHKQRNMIQKKDIYSDDYYSVSVFEDKEDALKLMNKVPYTKKKFKDISVGITKTDDGCLRKSSNSGNSHVDWWLYEDANPEKYFVLEKEEGHE